MDNGALKVVQLGRGIAWFDAGTIRNLFDAAQSVKAYEEKTGTKIACLEEVPWRQNWISTKQLAVLAKELPNSSYKEYLLSLVP